MRKDLAQCGKEFYKREFPWGMVTNGYALTPKLLEELLQSGLRSVTVSFDGLNPETHDWMRGKNGSWERAKNVIAMITSLENFTYDVVTCVNKRNIGDLEEIKKLLISLGVKN